MGAIGSRLCENLGGVIKDIKNLRGYWNKFIPCLCLPYREMLNFFFSFPEAGLQKMYELLRSKRILYLSLFHLLGQ